jgi:hypothetical protein
MEDEKWEMVKTTESGALPWNPALYHLPFTIFH